MDDPPDMPRLYALDEEFGEVAAPRQAHGF
jgi:hypothetical protein